jgi:PKD repeat protein
VVDQEGQFTTAFLLSPKARWQNQKQVVIIVQVDDSSTAAQASFSLVSSAPLPTATTLPTVEPAMPIEPAATPVEPTATSTPLSPTPAPLLELPTPTVTPQSSLTSITHLNIRSGPGLGYAIIGFLQPGQTAEVTGASSDGDWWQIKLPGIPVGLGWVSASYVTAEYTDDTPIVYVVSPPATAVLSPAPAPPEADFKANPRSGPAPLRVHFDNYSDGDYDSCRWSFGDDDASGDCADPDHTYEKPGRYTVRLQVRGPGGEDTKKREDYITVYAQPEAKFSASPTSGVAPLTVNFVNLSTGDYDTCIWVYGDGSTHAACSNINHIYTTPGVYTVNLVVSGLGGNNISSRIDYITVFEAATPTPEPPTPAPKTPAPTPEPPSPTPEPPAPTPDLPTPEPPSPGPELPTLTPSPELPPSTPESPPSIRPV